MALLKVTMSNEKLTSIAEPHPLLTRAFENLYQLKKEIIVTPKEREQFGLLAVGPFLSGDISSSFVESHEPTIAERIADEIVNQGVDEFIKMKNAANPQNRAIENKSKFRMVGWNETKKDGKRGVHFQLDPRGTDYGKLQIFRRENDMERFYTEDYIPKVGNGKHLEMQEFKNRFRPMTPTIVVFTITADNKLILFNRHPGRVGTYPNAKHGVGGYVEYSDVNRKRKTEPDQPEKPRQPNLYLAVLRELNEELGIPFGYDEESNHVTNITCLGMMMHRMIVYPEFCFLARTDFTSHDLIDESLKSPDSKRLKLSPRDADGDGQAHDIINSITGKPTEFLTAFANVNRLANVEDTTDVQAKALLSGEATAFLFQRALEQAIPSEFSVKHFAPMSRSK